MYLGQNFVECLHTNLSGMEENYLLWIDIFHLLRFVIAVDFGAVRSRKIFVSGYVLNVE